MLTPSGNNYHCHCGVLFCIIITHYRLARVHKVTINVMKVSDGWSNMVTANNTDFTLTYQFTVWYKNIAAVTKNKVVFLDLLSSVLNMLWTGLLAAAIFLLGVSFTSRSPKWHY